MQESVTNSAEETQKIAEEFAKTLKGGEVFVLSGDLGAGKTTFIQGLAKGLGVKNSITSPTFVLMKQYKGDNLQLVHIDCYRLDTNHRESKNESARIKFSRGSFKEELGLYEIEELGLDEIFEDKKNVVVIEWGERILSLLPKNTVIIKFEYLGEDKRRIKFKVQNPKFK